jgi:hypothetical protein
MMTKLSPLEEFCTIEEFYNTAQIFTSIFTIVYPKPVRPRCGLLMNGATGYHPPGEAA